MLSRGRWSGVDGRVSIIYVCFVFLFVLFQFWESSHFPASFILSLLKFVSRQMSLEGLLFGGKSQHESWGVYIYEEEEEGKTILTGNIVWESMCCPCVLAGRTRSRIDDPELVRYAPFNPAVSHSPRIPLPYSQSLPPPTFSPRSFKKLNFQSPVFQLRSIHDIPRHFHPLLLVSAPHYAPRDPVSRILRRRRMFRVYGYYFLSLQGNGAGREGIDV